MSSDLLEMSSEWTIRNLVAITATVSGLDDISGIAQFLDDAVGTPLGDVETVRNVPESHVRVICDTREDTTTDRQKL